MFWGHGKGSAPPCLRSTRGKAQAVAAGCTHSLVLMESGEVYGMGDNLYGQLGVNNTAPRLADWPSGARFPLRAWFAAHAFWSKAGDLFRTLWGTRTCECGRHLHLS